MVDYTTIKVSKPVSNWIANLKSVIEYRKAKKLTLEEALLEMCIITDTYYAKQMGLIKDIHSKEAQLFINKRAKQFWKESEDEPPTFQTIEINKIWEEE